MIAALAATPKAALFTLIPATAVVAGALAAIWQAPGPRVTSAVQHGAAGVVIAAVALEIVPAIRQEPAWVIASGFAVGLAVMLAMRAWAARLEDREGQAGIGLLLVTGVDVFVDGLVIGAGFAVGQSAGVLLAVALAFELVFLGVSTVSALVGAGTPRSRLLVVAAGLAASPVAGAVVGASVLGGASSQLIAGVLAFGAVALMYLVTEELLVEAHESGETAWGTVVLVAAFLIYLLIGQAVD